MEKKNTQHYKHLLDQHKEYHEDIVDDMENLTLGENDNNNLSELSNYDNHPSEIASELFDVEMQMGLKKLQEHEIKEIERAKEKIKKGTYGICESCKQPIEAARLELLPHAKLCVKCAKEEEKFIQDMKASKTKRVLLRSRLYIQAI